MCAFHVGRPKALLALVLAVVSLSWSPIVSGVAEAKVWAGHQTHFTSPSNAMRAPASPMRSHPAAVSHLGVPAPRSMPTGPVRAHNGMYNHFATLALSRRGPTGTSVRYHIALAHLSTHGSRVPEARERYDVVDARSSRLGHLAHMGVLGPLGANPTVRSPAAISGRPAVRWPIGAGAHPMAHPMAHPTAHPTAAAFIPPSQRTNRVWIPPMVAHHSGRR